VTHKGKQITWGETSILLLPQKVIFLPQYGTMLLADWHLGKATHFRKHGIYMPHPGVERELLKLQALIRVYHPGTVVFLGDLFHSDLNSEWMGFATFLKNHPTIRFVLTKGNHDILPEAAFEHAGLHVVSQLTIDEQIICTHIPMDDVPEGIINIAGHIHPGCSISSLGRQSYRLPCFYHHGQQLLIPAFGDLTGLAMMQDQPGARIFPIINDEVFD